MGSIYRSKKTEFDNMVYSYLVRKLKEPITQSDAYLSGTVDEYGNVNEGRGFNWAFTRLDKLIFDIKMELGDKVNLIQDDYNGVDYLLMMNEKIDMDKYNAGYAGVVTLVEESSYLPADFRGKDPFICDDMDGLTKAERISRALTVATYLLYCIKLDRIPNEREFNDILTSTEATFNVRSIGSYQDISDFVRKSHLTDTRVLSNEGYVLAVRLAKWIVGHELYKTSNKTVDNDTKNWKQLSTADM